MLRNALRKDLLLNARHLWGIVPWFVFAAWAMKDPGSGRMMTVGAAFVGSLMAVTIAAREDKLRTSATLASLPVSRRTLVQARYVASYVVGIGTYLAVAAMAVVLPWSVQPSAELFELNTLLLALALTSAAIALLMPVVLRFGMLGVVIFFGVFQVLGFVMFAAANLFGVRSGVEYVFGGIGRSITALHASLGQLGPIGETAVIVGICVWLSFRLSVVLADRREL